MYQGRNTNEIGGKDVEGGTAVKGGGKDDVGVNALHIDEQFNAGDTAPKANKLKCKNPTVGFGNT